MTTPSADSSIPSAGGAAGSSLVLVDPAVSHHERARPGDRLHRIVEERHDDLVARGLGDRLAVDDEAAPLTYVELEAWANRLAYHLSARGARAGDRIAVLLDRRPLTYVAMLAVSKLHATSVPLDLSAPVDRIAFVVDDAEVSMVLTTSSLSDRFDDTRTKHAQTTVVLLDAESRTIEARPTTRPWVLGGGVDDELCYLVYTSGTSGRPKGVAVEQRSVCNFVRVAAECYGVCETDRVYQGMTVAFDFSVEEIWVALAVGATLVPNPGPHGLVGTELSSFLRRRAVTALCCVPTLLATMTDDLPNLRFLLVSGEACPGELVERWHRPGRRFLNVYGPTEASVSATWTELVPGRPVTIGRPLPTYSAVVLDPEQPRALPPGVSGELGLAGVGLARGYVKRDDQTARAFVDDVVGMPHNPSGRIYRTGDLARITPDGEIEYLGRIDTQVKIRGYRIELAEIESLLMRHPDVAAAVVVAHDPGTGVAELAAYVTAAAGRTPLDTDAVVATLRRDLPAYMVPSTCDELPVLPMLASNKVDRRALPAPARRVRGGSTDGRAVQAPQRPLEHLCVHAFAEVLGLDPTSISLDDHLFDDLGANSLLLAHAAARLRESTGQDDLAMADLYQHPTPGALAAFLQHRVEQSGLGRPSASSWSGPELGRGVDPLTHRARSHQRAPHVASRAAYVGTAVAQTVAYVVFLLGNGHALAAADGLIRSGDGPLDVYLRMVAVAATYFVGLSALPVVAKWLLVGRWRPTEFPLWSPAYVRFWILRQLLRLSPMRAFGGTPLFNAYLRLLGARIGPGAVVFGRIPACPDLFVVGARAVIRSGVIAQTYKVTAGRVRCGPVQIGDDAYVGSGSVLDIGSHLGAGAALGHASSLQEGQVVAPRASVAGSPASPASTRFDDAPHLAPPPRHRVVLYSVAQVAGTVLLGVPSLIAVAALTVLLDTRGLLTAILLFAAVRVAIVAGSIVAPRLLAPFLPGDTPIPLYSGRYALARLLLRTSNSRFSNQLFGDSSDIVPYLRGVGLRMKDLRQTGSNFGLEQRWEAPHLTEIGSGSLVSDGLIVVNSELSASAFTLRTVRVPAESFFGNRITMPAGSRLGDDLMVGTKTMVPIDGPLRSGVGLLGSPAFEIPRSVRRDLEIDQPKDGPFFEAALRAKNRHNRRTMVLMFGVRFLYAYLVVLLGNAAVRYTPGYDGEGLAVAGMAALVAGVLFYAAVEWIVLGFRRLRPRTCSIYDRAYWRHERVWKVTENRHVRLLDGTPFKPLAWRLLGVRVGRMLFDGGANLTERTLVRLGDHVTLNEGALLQGHSLEDGVFKSDRLDIGDHVTVEPAAFVHYGTVIGEGSTIAPDAFLMKGEHTAPGTRWVGNPARPVSGQRRGRLPSTR